MKPFWQQEQDLEYSDRHNAAPFPEWLIIGGCVAEIAGITLACWWLWE